VAAGAAEGLAELASICGDGRRLLELISPEALENDLAVFHRLLQATTFKEQDRLSNGMQIRRLLPGWYPLVAPTAILLGYLARHFGRLNRVVSYVAVAKSAGLNDLHLPYIEELTIRIH
jgi:hypothetical protein